MRHHKTKYRSARTRVITLPYELNFWQKIDFSFIKTFIGPVILVLVAGILIVLAQWAILNRKSDSFTVGAPAPETYRVISRMRYDDQDSAKVLREMVGESVVGVTVRDVAAKSRLQRRLEAVRDMNNPASKPYLAYMPDALLKAISRLKVEDKSRILTLSYQIGSTYIDRLESEKVRKFTGEILRS